MLVSSDGEPTAKVMDQLAQHLDGSLRATDVLSTFAHSLISISMPYTSIEEAKYIADSLRRELAGKLYDHRTISFSIGLVHSTAGDQQPLELFRRAAEALDRARETGGNSFAVYEKGRPAGKASEIPSEREYHQLILLWNVMQVVSLSTDLERMAHSVCRHMLRTLRLQSVAMISKESSGISIVAGLSSDVGDLVSVSKLELSESEYHLVEAFFDDYGGDAQYEQTYLFHISSKIVLFLRADHVIDQQEVSFLRTLVGHFATGAIRLGQMEVPAKEPSPDHGVLIYQSP